MVKRLNKLNISCVTASLTKVTDSQIRTRIQKMYINYHSNKQVIKGKQNKLGLTTHEPLLAIYKCTCTCTQRRHVLLKTFYPHFLQWFQLTDSELRSQLGLKQSHTQTHLQPSKRERGLGWLFVGEGVSQVWVRESDCSQNLPIFRFNTVDKVQWLGHASTCKQSHFQVFHHS